MHCVLIWKLWLFRIATCTWVWRTNKQVVVSQLESFSPVFDWLLLQPFYITRLRYFCQHFCTNFLLTKICDDNVQDLGEFLQYLHKGLRLSWRCGTLSLNLCFFICCCSCLADGLSPSVDPSEQKSTSQFWNNYEYYLSNTFLFCE